MKNQTTQNPAVFEVKAQARRLREALQELQVTVTHSAALALIARAQGYRNWEALQSGLEKGDVSSPSAIRRIVEFNDESSAWLTWLQALLYFRGVYEDDLDELAYRTHGDEEASEINNQGMRAQLKARLDCYLEAGKPLQQAVEQLLRDLTEELSFTVEAPGPDVVEPAMPLRISFGEGSAHCLELRTDALEWFAQASSAEIEALVTQGLEGSEAGENVGLYLAKQSISLELREKVQRLLTGGSAIQALHPEIVGVSCYFEKDSVTRFIEETQADAPGYSKEFLARLGLHR